MVRGDRQLMFAGLAAGVSLLLAGAALAISVIVMGRPPVYQGLSADRSAAIAKSMRWGSIGLVFNVLLGLYAFAQVALRRPVLVSLERARRWPKVSAMSFGGFGVVAALVLFFGGSSMVMAIRSLAADTSKPLTDSSVFAGLRSPLGSMSLLFAILSTLLFTRWWQRGEEAGEFVEPGRTGDV